MTLAEMTALIPLAPSSHPAPAMVPEAARVPSNDNPPSTQAPVSYRATPWEVVELVPGLALMVAQNRGDLVRRLADEIWQRYGSAAR